MQVASSRPFMGYDRTDFFIPSAGATIGLMRPLPHMVYLLDISGESTSKTTEIDNLRSIKIPKTRL